MQIVLEKEQLFDIIDLAQKYRNSAMVDTRSLLEIVQELAVKGFSNRDYVNLCEYLHSIGYAAVLDVESIMLYGIEGGENHGSMESCCEYIQSLYGNGRGDIDLAVSYIAGKINLADYLKMGLDALTFTDDGKIVY